jgi:hypothetical protein
MKLDVKILIGFLYICTPAQVAKLVDAPSSGGGAARCAGSNPVLGTSLNWPPFLEAVFIVQFCRTLTLSPHPLNGWKHTYGSEIFIFKNQLFRINRTNQLAFCDQIGLGKVFKQIMKRIFCNEIISGRFTSTDLISDFFFPVSVQLV